MILFDKFRSVALEKLIDKISTNFTVDWFNDEVCQGHTDDFDYDCNADFCHWFMWKIGCSDSRILSRDIPELHVKRAQDPIHKFYNGAQLTVCWNHFRLDTAPLPGDILYLGNSESGEKEVLCVFLSNDENTWHMVEAGKSPYGDNRISVISRKLNGYKLFNDGEVEKTVKGWADITKLVISDNYF